MIWPIRHAVLLSCAGLALSGCQKEATGQVAAVVNGDEITLQELNAELVGQKIPEGDSKENAQKAALQRIIEMRLLAQTARDEEIDQSPEYLLRQRQLGDALLAQMLSQKVGRTMKLPDQAEIDDYVEQNPGMFSNRTVFAIDQIQFPIPSDPSTLQVLTKDHSMEAVSKTLDDLNIDYTRKPGQMDSLALGSDRLKTIQSLPDGEPFIIGENGMVTVGVITGMVQKPIAVEEARPVAARILRNNRLRDSLKQRLDAAKAKAEIKYKAGFAPENANGDAKKPGQDSKGG